MLGARPEALRPFFVMADVAANIRRKAQGRIAVISPLPLDMVQRIDALFEILCFLLCPSRLAPCSCAIGAFYLSTGGTPAKPTASVSGCN
jgi:hypothetical protein